MRNIILFTLLIIGFLLIFSAGSVHTGSVRENGRIGLDMLFKGILFIGAAFVVLLIFRSKKD